MAHKHQQNPDHPFMLSRLWRFPLILGALFGFLLSAVVVQLSAGERERDFMVAAEGAGIDFREHLAEGEGVINNIVLLFNASSHVTESEFRLFINSQFNTHLDIKSVYFLADKGGDNRYAREAAAVSQTVVIPGEVGGSPLAQLYSVGHPNNAFSKLGWEAWNEARTVQAIGAAIAQGGITMGGVMALDDGSIAFSQYRAVYNDGGRGELLGVIAVLFRPADVVKHIAQDYRVNVAVSVAGQMTGVAVCCREVGEKLLPTFVVDDGFDYRGMPFQLRFSKGLGWGDVYMKVAVLAFVIGALLVMVMRRLRMANMARTQMLLERNRTIKRQVEEQTRALRVANTELVQQKAALDEHAIVSIADPSGNITYVNEKFCEISGYHSDELVGRNHRIVKSDRHPSEFYDEMWNTITQGKVWHGEVCNRSKQGDEYWVNSTIVPFLDERGLPYQYVSIRTDITALKAAKLAMVEHDS